MQVIRTYQTWNTCLLSYVRIFYVYSFLGVEGSIRIVLFHALRIDCLGVSGHVADKTALLCLGAFDVAVGCQAQVFRNVVIILILLILSRIDRQQLRLLLRLPLQRFLKCLELLWFGSNGASKTPDALDVVDRWLLGSGCVLRSELH